MKHTFRAGDKPLDFGHGGISGCLTHTGRFLAINHYHPVHGYVTLSSAPPFPDEARYDPARVREYRRDLVALDGFGVVLPSDVVRTVVKYDKYANPILTMTLANGATVRCVTHIFTNGIFQDWKFSQPTTILITGRVWVMRCAYPQLTEGGVLPPVSHQSIIKKDEIFSAAMNIENPSLSWEVTLNYHITLIPDTNDAIRLEKNIALNKGEYPIMFKITTQIQMEFWKELWLKSLLKELNRYYFNYHNQKNSLTRLELPLMGEKDYPDDPIHTRAWRYARICATPTESDTVCILTDHIILPLSWNRDAYYTARLFLDHPQTHILAQKHLLWMFQTAERINGLWGRSYLANGNIKDRGFQLDQQLFPLLELAEYVQITGDTALLDRLREYIQPIFTALAPHRAPHALLYATDETPADDPIAQPYPLSSHILLWKVLVELEKIGCAALLPHTPNEIAQTIMAHFIGTHNDTSLFAYATDGHGGHHFYHDANDVPLVLMPVWGFCAPHDPVWLETMNFAFSDANIGGFYDGVLGSVHTPAPWTLGDCQEWIFSRVIGDSVRENSVIARLRHASQWDGGLSEAYDKQTGDVVSRHWFLWTNALYACIKRGIFDVK
jgi:hypothetical protein